MNLRLELIYKLKMSLKTSSTWQLFSFEDFALVFPFRLGSCFEWTLLFGMSQQLVCYHSLFCSSSCFWLSTRNSFCCWLFLSFGSQVCLLQLLSPFTCHPSLLCLALIFNYLLFHLLVLAFSLHDLQVSGLPFFFTMLLIGHAIFSSQDGSLSIVVMSLKFERN